MPFVKLFEESEEGNFYPQTAEHFVSDEILEQLIETAREDQYWEVHEMNERYRAIQGYSSIVDHNGNF